MREGGFLTSWLPRAFCGELMLNCVVPVGALYVANQMCALSLLQNAIPTWELESIHRRFLSCGYNECCRYIECKFFRTYWR